MGNFLDLALEAANNACREILTIWNSCSLSVEQKLDGSPITLADKKAHEVILHTLARSDLPVVSEESDDLQLAAHDYWLVDPLDGTKEFVAGNPEFTVNIARITHGFPVLGIVSAPALSETFVGVARQGAWRIDSSGTQDLVAMARASGHRVAVSRFHDHADTELFISLNSITTRVAIGSALKYGRLAAAEVDVFPRFAGSSEWDTAAGQAVLEAVGGSVLDYSTGQRLRYGKPQRRNPQLFSFRSPYKRDDFILPHSGSLS